jgi:hypothetical protein
MLLEFKLKFPTGRNRGLLSFQLGEKWQWARSFTFICGWWVPLMGLTFKSARYPNWHFERCLIYSNLDSIGAQMVSWLQQTKGVRGLCTKYVVLVLRLEEKKGLIRTWMVKKWWL